MDAEGSDVESVAVDVIRKDLGRYLGMSPAINKAGDWSSLYQMGRHGDLFVSAFNVAHDRLKYMFLCDFDRDYWGNTTFWENRNPAEAGKSNQDHTLGSQS